MVQQKEREQKMMDKSPHEEGEFKQKDELLNNGHATENRSNKTADQHNDKDILDKSRCLLLTYIFSSHALVPIFFFFFPLGK